MGTVIPFRPRQPDSAREEAQAERLYAGEYWDDVFNALNRETPAQKWVRLAAARLREMGDGDD